MHTRWWVYDSITLNPFALFLGENKACVSDMLAIRHPFWRITWILTRLCNRSYLWMIYLICQFVLNVLYGAAVGHFPGDSVFEMFYRGRCVVTILQWWYIMLPSSKPKLFLKCSGLDVLTQSSMVSVKNQILWWIRINLVLIQFLSKYSYGRSQCQQCHIRSMG